MGQSILVVGEAIIPETREELESEYKYEFLLASDREEAEAIINEHRPRIIFVSAGMSDAEAIERAMDGRQTLLLTAKDGIAASRKRHFHIIGSGDAKELDQKMRFLAPSY